MNKIKKIFENHTREKITALLFLLIIFGMFIGTALNARTVGASFINTYRASVPTGAPYLERIKGAISAAESAVNEGAFQRQKYIELYGLSQRAMGKNVITDYNYGSLYKTTYGQITFAGVERYVDDSCGAVYDLVNNLISKDIDFLYIQLPFKVPPARYNGDKQLPANVKDHANDNADKFVAALNAASVKTYDLRDDFWQSDMTQNELFFDTDHHWSIQGAFYATGLIADYLNENYDMQIPESLYTKENFSFKTYENSYIGSMGRRVGRIYGGIDDFTLITPNFATDYTVRHIEGEEPKEFSGTFAEAVLENEYITDPDPTTNRYAVYHGDYRELHFINHLAQGDKKILIIKDSFSLPVYSFLSLGIKEVRAIDMRLFDRNVAEYAAEYDPDLVILMYNADSFAYPMFDFHLGE
ncbi:MAG: hypothetical protein HFG67_01905 [Firmicutes bacterium]|nr:hypothetical protein [Bacillota bacterium]